MNTKRDRRPTSQMNLLLRIIAGAYLMYLAFDMRGNFGDSPLFVAAAVLFVLTGLALLVVSIRRMISGDFDYLDSKGNIIIPDDLPEEKEEAIDE